MLLGGEAAGQNPADGLLSAVYVVLQVLSLRQLPHELTLLLQQGELEGRERGGWGRYGETRGDVWETTFRTLIASYELILMS